MIEVWQSIFDGSYEASSLGRVRRLRPAKGATVGAFIRPNPDKDGYMQVGLHLSGEPKRTVKVHRLVATLFIPNPLDLPQVNHCNGDKTNNRVDNLEWSTCLDNNHHAWDTGLCAGRIKIGPAEAERMRSLAADGWSQSEIATEFGVHQTAVSYTLRLKQRHLRVLSEAS